MMSDFRGGGVGGSKMTQKNQTLFMHDPLCFLTLKGILDFANLIPKKTGPDPTLI